MGSIVLLAWPKASPDVLRARDHIASMTTIPVKVLTARDLHSSATVDSLYTALTRTARGRAPIFIRKLLFPWTYPGGTDKLLVLDSDIVLRRDPSPLFRLSVPGAALVEEQSSHYANKYQGVAFNGGVQLLNLRALREDPCYLRELWNVARFGRVGWHGDQTVYSMIREKCPHLFAILPCGWNRQTGSFMQDVVTRTVTNWSRVACDDCHLLHLNTARLKGYAQNLRTDCAPERLPPMPNISRYVVRSCCARRLSRR